jgi:hypothetical protein
MRTLIFLYSDILYIEVGVRETKVNNFDVVVGIEEHVLGFEVAVDDVELVDIINTIYDLMKKSTSLFLSESGCRNIVYFFF